MAGRHAPGSFGLAYLREIYRPDTAPAARLHPVIGRILLLSEIGFTRPINIGGSRPINIGG